VTKGQKIALVVIGFPCLCCVGGIGVVQCGINSAGSGLEAELAKAKAQGYPVEVADYYRKVPLNESAAPLYKKLMALEASDPELNKSLRAAGVSSDTASEEEKKAQAAAWPKIGSAISLIERAADKPHAGFNRNWEAEGFDVMFPELAEMKGYAKVLANQALRQSKSGDTKGALTSIDRARRMGEQANEDRVLIGMLVDIALQAIAIRALSEVVEQHQTDLATLKMARQELGRFKLPSFKDTMKGEFVFGRAGLHLIHGPADFDISSNSGADQAMEALIKNKAVMRAFETRYVKTYREFLDSLPDDPAAWQQATEASRNFEKKVEDDKSIFNYLNRILFPVFNQASNAVGTLEVRKNLVDIEIGLYEAKLKTGRFPKNLLQFGDKAKDPFSGDLLVYKVDPTGFLIYSIGQDGTDDGGALRSKNGRLDLGVDTRKKP
jgi:hypothetical protein